MENTPSQETVVSCTTVILEYYFQLGYMHKPIELMSMCDKFIGIAEDDISYPIIWRVSPDS